MAYSKAFFWLNLLIGSGFISCSRSGVLRGMHSARARILTKIRRCLLSWQPGRLPGVALLQTEERGITAAASQQILVPAPFGDLAVLDDEDSIGMHDGVQTVRDHDGGAILAQNGAPLKFNLFLLGRMIDI